ncbi:hypothetical protein FRC12_013359 [Ceratobasidium sp. 428]|nr:hypothetical protein FRC12_013359 [Ceratobasidium sp. 428]
MIIGFLLYRRFQRLGDLADTDQAVEYCMLAAQLTPEADQFMPTLLTFLVSLLCDRYRRIGNEEDLDHALEYAALGAQLTSDGHEIKPDLLVYFGTVLEYRYERHRNSADIDQAIECVRLAVRTQPEDHRRRLAWFMHMLRLGRLLYERYEQRGNLLDLNQTVECHTMALRHSPAGDTDTISRALGRLVDALLYRYQRLGSMRDLEQAIEYLEYTDHRSSDGYSDFAAKRLGNIATSLALRYNKLGDPADIDRAIEYHSQSIQLVPEGRPEKVEMIYNLACSLRWRYARFGNAADLDLAIEHMSSALKLTPDGHYRKPLRLDILGSLLSDRFKGFRNQADIYLAVHYLIQAVELAPNGHSQNPCHLLSLGEALETWLHCTHEPLDVRLIMDVYRKGAKSPITNPRAQIICAGKWANYSIRLQMSPFEAYQTVFALLPHFVWLGQTVQARYSSISMISDLISIAVAWAVLVGSYDLALEWLEQGRSVVWTQLLQTRTPCDDLAAVDTRLADWMRGIASQLEAAEGGSEAICSSVDSPFDLDIQGQRYSAALQWDQLLREVRQVPGFEDYMLPRKAHILKKAAIRGPVVVINTHEALCNALIIVPDLDDMIHVPLVRLTKETLCRTRADMISLIGHRGDEDKPRGFKRYKSSESAQDKLHPLKVLWVDIVEPILDALQYTNKPVQDDLPHITWCATGMLSFFPLHAAGLYDGTSRNTFDLVVSSYTPTLAALLAPDNAGVMPHAGVLAVGQVNTPGLSPLPKTADELTIVGKYTAATGYSQLEGPMATVDATLDAMDQYSWVHLACHAIQNRADPRQSAFYLHDGKLTLETITRRAFKHKGLAFLSACQTATGDDVLPDEAMHLAAGMLAAGYPTVIATMWSIADEDGPEIAEIVYGELMKGGKADHTKAAMALHNATKKLRDKVRLEEIWRWAPFIHIGL